MLVLIGLCHGFHSNTRKFGDKEFTDHQVLIEVQQTSQYGTSEVKTIPVKLSKRQHENGVQHVWEKLKGTQVSVPVFIGAWASKSGSAGYDIWLSGDGKPANVQLGKSAAA